MESSFPLKQRPIVSCSEKDDLNSLSLWQRERGLDSVFFLLLLLRNVHSFILRGINIPHLGDKNKL